MPEEIINRFKDQYGKDGEGIYYATANKQGRDPETFKKESAMENKTLEQLEKELDEEMAGLNGSLAPAIVSSPAAQLSGTTDIAPPCEVGAGVGPGPSIVPPSDTPAISLAPSPIVGSPSAGLPETVPGEVVPPIAPPIMEGSREDAINKSAEAGGIDKVEKDKEEVITEKKDKKDDKKKEDFLKQVKGAGAGKDRKGNTHMPKAKQVHKTKKDKETNPKHKPDWKKFDESVNLYLTKTSRNSDIGVNSLEKMWKECVEEQAKSTVPRSSRKFWVEVRTKFDRKVNNIFLQEAKKRMTERQKLNASIETFLEHVAKDNYVEAKPLIKEMAASCVNSMISERKVQYQKTLAEEIAKKVRETK